MGFSHPRSMNITKNSSFQCRNEFFRLFNAFMMTLRIQTTPFHGRNIPWTTIDHRWSPQGFPNELVVEPTHLKNMLVKLDHFPKYGWKEKTLSCHHPANHISGQIIIFHQPGFSWNKGSHFPSFSPPFGGVFGRVFGRDLIWPDIMRHSLGFGLGDQGVKHQACLFKNKRDERWHNDAYYIACTCPSYTCKYNGNYRQYILDIRHRVSFPMSYRMESLYTVNSYTHTHAYIYIYSIIHV